MEAKATYPLVDRRCSPYDGVIAKNVTIPNVNFRISLGGATLLCKWNDTHTKCLQKTALTFSLSLLRSISLYIWTVILTDDFETKPVGKKEKKKQIESILRLNDEKYKLIKRRKKCRALYVAPLPHTHAHSHQKWIDIFLWFVCALFICCCFCWWMTKRNWTRLNGMEDGENQKTVYLCHKTVLIMLSDPCGVYKKQHK